MMSSSFSLSSSHFPHPSPPLHPQSAPPPPLPFFVPLIHDLLTLRNSLTVDHYKEIFSSHEELQTKIKSLKAKINTLEGDLANKSTGGNSNNANLPSSSSSLSSSSPSLLKLQEDLTLSYRQHSEMASTTLRLKEKNEKDEKTILTLEAQLQGKIKEIEQQNLRVKTLESTIEVMRTEVTGSKTSQGALDNKIKTLEDENKKLIEQIIRLKDEQAKQLNANNELIYRLEREREGDSKDRKSASGATSSPFQGMGTGSIASSPVIGPNSITPASISVELDFTSSNNIIDHVAWQSNFQVTIPTERKKLLRSHRGPAMTARYNSSGTLIASGGTDGFVKVWDARSGALKASLRGTKDSVMVVCFSADDSLLMAAGNDQSARIWSMKSSRIVHTLLGHQSKIYAGAFSMDGEFCITGSHDRTIRLWDVQQEGSLKRTILCHSSCNSLALASNENYLASAHLDSHIRFWSIRSGELMADLDSIHTQQATGIDFSRDGLSVVSTSRDNTIKIIDVRTWKILKTLDSPTQNNKIKEEYKNLINWNRPTFSPDGQYVIAGSSTGTLFCWNADSGKCVGAVGVQQQGGTTGADGGLGVSTPTAAGGGSFSSSATSLVSNSSSSSSSSNAIPDAAISCVDWNKNGRQALASDMAGNVILFESAV